MLRSKAGSSMQLVPSARVPVLNFKLKQTDVECDLCIANREGVYKSTFFRELSRIDHRFPDLVRLVRATGVL